MKVLVAALVLVSLSLAIACDEVGVRGSGDLVKEEYEFEDFTRVGIRVGRGRLIFSGSYPLPNT